MKEDWLTLIRKTERVDEMILMEETSPYKKDNEVLTLAFQFALGIIDYTERLEALRRFNMAHQLFKSGTSIHANTREAQNAESKDDFIHKMKVAAKEAEETEGWLLPCKHAKSYPDTGNLFPILGSIMRLLNKIIGSSKRGRNDNDKNERTAASRPSTNRSRLSANRQTS